MNLADHGPSTLTHAMTTTVWASARNHHPLPASFTSINDRGNGVSEEDD
jgi:hypothetical protein